MESKHGSKMTYIHRHITFRFRSLESSSSVVVEAVLTLGRHRALLWFSCGGKLRSLVELTSRDTKSRSSSVGEELCSSRTLYLVRMFYS